MLSGPNLVQIYFRTVQKSEWLHISILHFCEIRLTAQNFWAKCLYIHRFRFCLNINHFPSAHLPFSVLLELTLFKLLLFIVPLQDHAHEAAFNWTQLLYRGRRWSCGTSSPDISVSLMFYYPCVDPPLTYSLTQKMNAMPHLSQTWTLTSLTEYFGFNPSTNDCILVTIMLLAQALLYMHTLSC